MTTRATTILVLVITASCRGDAGKADQLAQCRSLAGEGVLRRPGLEVHLRSSIARDGEVAPGPVPACGAAGFATGIFLAAHAALARAPANLRPELVTIHVDPVLPPDARPVHGIEVHQPSATILVDGSHATEMAAAVWLHEYAHLLMRGDRPRGRVAGKLFAALEEGIADYYAAAVQGSPVLRSAGKRGSRDLRHPPRGIGSGWEALALHELRFDEHRHGWQLAAQLWRHSPRLGPVVEDLIECMASAEFGQGPPREVMRQWLAVCPERNRAAIDQAVRAWLPDELQPGR